LSYTPPEALAAAPRPAASL